jgi:hypothetical protein
MTTRWLAAGTAMLLGLLLAAGAVGAADSIWTEKDGLIHVGDLNDYLTKVAKGQVVAPELRAVLKSILPEGEKWTEEQLTAAAKTLEKASVGFVLLGQVAEGEALAKASEEFATRFQEGAKGAAGTLRGTVYKIKDMHSEQPSAQDPIYLLPADPAFWGALRKREEAEAEKAYRARLLEVLRKAQAEGAEEMAATIKIVEAGGLPAQGDPGLKLANDLRRQMMEEGAFEPYNDYELFQKYRESGAIKAFVKETNVAPSGEFVFKDVPPGEYLIYYRQTLLTYIYRVTIAPGKEISIMLARPFSWKKHVVTG